MSADLVTDEVMESQVVDSPELAGSSFEVVVRFLQIVDADGHRHWLSAGQELPGWVGAEQASQLVRSGAVFEFRRI